MTNPCCGNCNAFLKQSPDGNGLCRANPPIPILVGTQQQRALVNGPMKVQPVVIGFHPPRNENDWCRAHHSVEAVVGKAASLWPSFEIVK